MTQKEKLTWMLSLLMDPQNSFVPSTAADYLIDHGVVVLPCRCGECEHKDNELLCPSYHVWFDNRDNWFCADAKRKGGEE